MSLSTSLALAARIDPRVVSLTLYYGHPGGGHAPSLLAMHVVGEREERTAFGPVALSESDAFALIDGRADFLPGYPEIRRVTFDADPDAFEWFAHSDDAAQMATAAGYTLSPSRQIIGA